MMGGAASRNKGHNFERDIARRFRDLFPAAKRGIQTRFGGGEAADVIVPHFHLELKRWKSCNIKKALQQATEECEAGKVPVAICKDDRKRETVTMYLDDFLPLVKEAKIKDRIV